MLPIAFCHNQCRFHLVHEQFVLSKKFAHISVIWNQLSFENHGINRIHIIRLFLLLAVEGENMPENLRGKMKPNLNYSIFNLSVAYVYFEWYYFFLFGGNRKDHFTLLKRPWFTRLWLIQWKNSRREIKHIYDNSNISRNPQSANKYVAH